MGENIPALTEKPRPAYTAPMGIPPRRVVSASKVIGVIGPLCLSVLLSVSPVMADGEPAYRAAVVHLHEGASDGYETAYWENAAVSPLQQAGFHVISAGIVRVAVPDTAPCLASDACIQALAARLHTPTFFVVTTRAAQTSEASFSTITVTHEGVDRSEPQSVSTSTNLSTTLKSLGEQVASSGRPCELVLGSEDGFEIEVNGAPFSHGTTSLFLPPGDHQLLFTRPGRQASAERLTCTAGERWQVSVQ